MQMYLGDDDSAEDEAVKANSAGGIVVEALSNIRTVASLTLEDERLDAFAKALENEDPHAVRHNVTKGPCRALPKQKINVVVSPTLRLLLSTGATSGLGQFVYVAKRARLIANLH